MTEVRLVMKSLMQIKWAAVFIVLATAFMATGMVIGAAYNARQAKKAESAKPLSAGLVDVGFSQHMVWHHSQAVEIAKIIQRRASAQSKLLAEQISTHQLMEMGEMKGWLQIWNAPILSTSTSMDWVFKNPNAKWNMSPVFLDLCRSAPGGQPGVATIDELTQLRSATGKKLDILFLQLMLRHHMSALPMARYAKENAETPVVRSTAAKIIDEQRQEIHAMRTLLKQLGAEPLPFPDVDSV